MCTCQTEEFQNAWSKMSQARRNRQINNYSWDFNSQG